MAQLYIVRGVSPLYSAFPLSAALARNSAHPLDTTNVFFKPAGTRR